MSILSSAILTVCMGAQGDYSPACEAALEQGASRYGIEQDLDHFERREGYLADKQAETTLGQNGKFYLGSSLYLAKVIVDRRFSYNLPTMGLANQIQSQLTPESFLLTVRWNFE